MNLYACCSESHLPLLERHFLPSARAAGFERVHVVHVPQYAPNGGVIGGEGFARAVREKVLMVQRVLAGELAPFVVSDVDVRFYGADVAMDLRDLMARAWPGSLLCQRDSPARFGVSPGELCSGFMVIRPGYEAECLWALVRARMAARPHEHDQTVLNAVVEAGQARFLPSRYWSAGAASPETWTWRPGDPVPVPPCDLRMHHANRVVGVPAKLALLDGVQASFRGTT